MELRVTYFRYRSIFPARVRIRLNLMFVFEVLL